MNKEKGFGGKKNLWLKAVERKFKYSSESKIDDPSSRLECFVYGANKFDWKMKKS